MIRVWIERIKALLFGGIVIKILILLGAAAVIGLLHFILWELVAPAWDLFWNVLSHSKEILKK